MENIFIEFLPPWVETGLQPAFYDKESGTVLQQVSRMYPKINELIKSFNQISKEFKDLHDYVYDYFDNLDVQEEINNKLDDMAESGQLVEIISAYLNAKSVLAYDTVSAMKSAENLIDGCFVATYGNTTLNDGYGGFYKVRELEEGEVVDEVKLIALNNPTLVAELIIDSRLDNIEELQNKLIGRSRVVELACDLIYDANDTDITQGCAMIGNTLYSCERGADNITGKIVTFDMSTHTYGTTYSSLQLWHAGDATSLNNKIYTASYSTSANKCLTVFDPLTQIVTDIYPFASSTKALVGGVASHNGKLLCKIEDNSNLVQLIGAEYFMYDPSDSSVVEYTISNPMNLPINYWGSTQSTCCNDNKYYILTSSPNSIIECLIDDDNHTLTMNAIYSLPLSDSRGLTIGELQGIAINPNADNEMIITTYIKDNGINNVHTTKVYRLNLVSGNPDSLIKFPTTNNHENGHQVIYVDQTSTSLYENGTTTYPYKTLNRGVSAISHQGKQWNTYDCINITGNGTYQLPKLFNKSFCIIANTGVTINFAQATRCNLEISSGTTRPLVVFDASFGASQIQDNCFILFKNVVLQNSAHNIVINNSTVRTYTCLVNANANFFSLDNNSTFYDGSHTDWTFDDPSYYAYNVSGGSQLFLFDNESPFSPSDVGDDKPIRRSARRGTVIFPGLYS